MEYANIKPSDIDKVVLSNDTFNKNGVANILLNVQPFTQLMIGFWKIKILEKNFYIIKKILSIILTIMDGKKDYIQ